MLKERVMFLKRKKNKRETPYLFISVVFNMPQMNLVTYVPGGRGGSKGMRWMRQIRKCLLPQSWALPT